METKEELIRFLEWMRKNPHLHIEESNLWNLLGHTLNDEQLAEYYLKITENESKQSK
jgi:hypothetical protein